MTTFRTVVYVLVDIWIAVAALWFAAGFIGWIITLVRPAHPRLATGAGPARRAARPTPARRASLRLVDER